MANDANSDATMDSVLTTYLQKAAERDFEPYVKQISESFKRSLSLVEAAKKINGRWPVRYLEQLLS